MVLNYLIQKEFIQFRRNAFLPKLIFVFPVIIMCVMPWVMNMEVKNIRVSMVDNDRSSRSRLLVTNVAHSPYFIFNARRDSYAEALADIERGVADMVVVIPRGYERNGVSGKPTEVLIAANAVNGTKGAIGTAYLTNIVVKSPSGGMKALKEQVNALH
ncbi:MAG TPA: ABC transporter permease, partial [Prevotella sp.]